MSRKSKNRKVGSTTPPVTITPPAAITKPKGLLGEIAELFYQNSFVPNRMVAYAGAVTAMAMIMGGRYRTFGDGVKPGLYISIIGKTGIGKDAVFTNIKSLFQDLIIYAGQRDGTLKYLSWATLAPGSSIEGIEDQIKELNARPDVLFPIDEIGRLLDDNKNDKFNALITFLMASYDSKFIEIRKLSKRGKEGLKKDEIPFVMYPTISVVGATTMNSLSNGISMEQLYDGFINRFLWLHVDSFTEATRMVQKDTAPSAGLLKALTKLARIGNEEKAPYKRTSKPKVIKYGSGVYELFRDLDNNIRMDDDSTDEDRGFKIRMALQAKKLAIVMCPLGKGRNGRTITMEIAKEAIEVVKYSAELMIKAAGETLIDESEPRIIEAIKKLLDDNVSKKKAISKTSLNRIYSYKISKSKTRLIENFLDIYSEEYSIGKAKFNSPGRPVEYFYKVDKETKLKWVRTLPVTKGDKVKIRYIGKMVF